MKKRNALKVIAGAGAAVLATATQSLAVLSAEATAAQTAVEGLIVDMSGLGWTIATAVLVASAGIGLFLRFAKKGGAR